MKTKKSTGTLSIPFADPAKVLHMSLPLEERAVQALGAVIACLVVGYIVFVSMSVVNVIASKEAADKISALRASVSQLENDYFALSDTVTKDSGVALGLTPVSKTNYVSRTGTVGAATRPRNDL